jgi:D-alanyl-D-alanine-carboxypeptidase/D-alanyl-D-alanine-endopeptidase
MGIKLMSKTVAVLITSFLMIFPETGYAVDLRPEIDPLVQQLLAEDTAVGMVVGIYKDGETQVIGYGETEKGTGIAPDADTVYEIGSASKVFTGALLADMIERGRVKLTNPMQMYLPPATKEQLKNPTHITFEHLVTHTSGLPALPDNLQPADMLNPYADYSFKQIFAFLKDHKLRRDPGEYEYSNFGMGLLGVLLSSREKSTYEKLLIERIANPCGMDDTSIKLSDKQRKRLAAPYDAALQPTKNWDVPTLAGAGGIRSTTNDMLKFVEANLAEDDKPLSKALRLSHEKRHVMPDGDSIGLAWHIQEDGITHWHNGMTGGYASWVAVVPSRKVGVVILSNTATMKITELGQQITSIALGEKVEPPKPAPVVKVAPKVLKKYVGDYAITPQFVISVTVEDSNLMVQATGQPKFRVFPESETKFYLKVVDAQVSFVGEKHGKAEMLILHQGGANQVAMRQN